MFKDVCKGDLLPFRAKDWGIICMQVNVYVTLILERVIFVSILKTNTYLEL